MWCLLRCIGSHYGCTSPGLRVALLATGLIYQSPFAGLMRMMIVRGWQTSKVGILHKERTAASLHTGTPCWQGEFKQEVNTDIELTESSGRVIVMMQGVARDDVTKQMTRALPEKGTWLKVWTIDLCTLLPSKSKNTQ